MKTLAKITTWGVVVLFAAPLAAQEALPKGDAIMDKYIDVTGGKDAYAKVRSAVYTGAMDIPAAGIKGKVTSYRAAPNKMYTEANLEGLGKTEEGTDGMVVWEISSFGGPRVKQGEERTAALRQAAFDADTNWRKHFAKVETKGVEKVDGKDCYKLELTATGENPQTRFYDKSSGLLVKLVAKPKTQVGELPIETAISDYKKVGEVLIPHKIQIKANNMDIILTFDKVEQNVTIPDDRFKLPDDIKKLAEKKKSPEKPGKELQKR